MIMDDYCKKKPQEYFSVKSVRMKNFRCFSQLNVEFNTINRMLRIKGQEIEVAPLTVIVAKNGMGKSTVLDAVRIAFGTFTSAFDYPSRVHISRSDISIVTNPETNQTAFRLPVEIETVGELNYQTCEWRRVLAKETGRTTTGEAVCISDFGKTLKKEMKGDNGDSVVLPLIAYYGTSRLWKDHKETDKEKPLVKPRDFGYDYCLGDDSNYKAVYKWTKDALWAEMTANHLALKKDMVLHRQLQAIRKALGCVLEQEGYSNFLHFNSYYKELAIIRQYDPERNEAEVSLPVSSLSDGVRALFSIVSDIAFRSAKLNPALGENACRETPGIILIDEIDQHLHPAWQQKILDTLQSVFRKMQFIVTTHSPQIISSVPRECVRVIENGKVIPFDTPTQGVDVSDILAGIFGTDPIPQNTEIIQKLNRLHSMLAEGLGDSDEWNSLYSDLELYYGKQYPPLLGALEHKRFLKKVKENGRNA